MSDIVERHSGTSPVILGFPHTGTEVPEHIQVRLNANGLLLADTDWHLHELYRDLLPNVSWVRTRVHRYVIDANRDPTGTSLYPGQNTTELVPTTDFDNRPIWNEGQAPDATDIASRVRDYHRPYHAALEAEIERVRAAHGFALVFDCHSIRSRIPFLFEGQLPDFNIGTDGGATCDASIEDAAIAAASAADGFSWVANGRFRGGWTTRHYGRRGAAVQSIQLELAQVNYLQSETVPFAYDPRRAHAVRTHLAVMLRLIEAVARTLSRKTK